MSKYVIGQIVKGKVIGLQQYGAFIALDEEVKGLIHISEITDGFVRDIRDFLNVGDAVMVKVIAINPDDGNVALSLRDDHATLSECGRTIDQKGSRASLKLGLIETKSGFRPLRAKMDFWVNQFYNTRKHKQ